KGVPEDIIERVAGEINDTESAYRAALGRVRCLSLTDYQLFCGRLGSYLKRRGFDDEVISHTLARVWQEMGGNPANRKLSPGYLTRT
ncbi:MAG: RecX family transcriptional regulator, partial [Chloroflexota bacterium]